MNSLNGKVLTVTFEQCNAYLRIKKKKKKENLDPDLLNSKKWSYLV